MLKFSKFWLYNKLTIEGENNSEDQYLARHKLDERVFTLKRVFDQENTCKTPKELIKLALEIDDKSWEIYKVLERCNPVDVQDVTQPPTHNFFNNIFKFVKRK